MKAIGHSTVLAALLAVAQLVATPAWASSPPLQTDVAAASAVASDTTAIYVVLGVFHTDIVIPRAAFVDAPPLIKAAVDRAPEGSWISVGWGPYWFGRVRQPDAPYHNGAVLWANALFTLVAPQGGSLLRIVAMPAPGAAPGEINKSMATFRLSPADLAHMLKRINDSFVASRDGGPVLADMRGADPGISLYKSREIYHLTHECNHWAAEVLHAGGVRSLPAFALLPASLDVSLKLNGAASPAPSLASSSTSAPAQ